MRGEGTQGQPRYNCVDQARNHTHAEYKQRPQKDPSRKHGIGHTLKTKKLTIPDSQLLVDLACLQDMDEMLQVIDIGRPRQVCADRSNNLRGSNRYVFMLQN